MVFSKMMNGIKEPLYLLQRFILILFLLIFASCSSTSQTAGRDSRTDSNQTPSEMLVFINKTHLNVHIKRGSGRIDVGTVAPRSQIEVRNVFDLAETYYPSYEIPMTGAWSLSEPRMPADRDFYFQSSRTGSRQEVEITLPPALDDQNVYIVFTNASRSGGVSVNNSSGIMTGLNQPSGGGVVNAGETAVFGRSNLNDFENLRVTPGNINFGRMTFQRGHVYSFEYNGTRVVMTDERPLHRMGEAPWSQTVSGAQGKMHIVSANGRLNLFYPARQGIQRSVYDPAGNEISPQTGFGGSFEIEYAGAVEGGYLLAGYEESGGVYRPVARVHGEDGVLRRSLEPSNTRSARSAFFKTAVQIDSGNLFFAGGGGESANAGTAAYARFVRYENSQFTQVRELTGSDFNAASSSVRCGEITAAAYDPARDRIIAAGQVLTGRFDASASYIAEISRDGRVLEVNTSFRNMTFYNIIPAPDGYYLAGEEIKGDNTYAFAAKYQSGGRLVWQVREQPQADSFYQCAFLDGENPSLILAGSMRAGNSGGINGIPFIDRINTENGDILFREGLSNSSLTGAHIVTDIVNAPDYGFAMTLSGVTDFYTEPFIIARVNSFGKY